MNLLTVGQQTAESPFPPKQRKHTSYPFKTQVHRKAVHELDTKNLDNFLCLYPFIISERRYPI